MKVLPNLFYLYFCIVGLVKPQLSQKQAENFCRYLETHRQQIINYDYYQSEQICSIGSGTVDSTVKQIDRRLKISGTQWNEDNVIPNSG